MVPMDPEKAKKKVMMMAKVGMMFAVIGFLMVSTAIYIEFTEFKPALEQLYENPKAVWETATRADNPELVNLRIAAFSTGPMLLTLKLGGIGFILTGIFISLVAILKVLAMMPDRLGMIMKGR